jgi:uncharacterized YccA/Bax inhibitor family protein
VIPTMILFGLVFGRWWKTTLVAGTLGWSLLLLAGGILHSLQEVAGAAALGLANTLVGVAIHQLFLRLVRALRRRRTSPARQGT